MNNKKIILFQNKINFIQFKKKLKKYRFIINEVNYNEFEILKKKNLIQIIKLSIISFLNLLNITIK